MSKILGVVKTCRECPHRRYYSAGAYDCEKAGARLPDTADIPEWCPLANHPAYRIIELEQQLKDARYALDMVTKAHSRPPDRSNSVCRIPHRRVPTASLKK